MTRRIASLLFALTLAACGDDDDTSTIDGGTGIDAGPPRAQAGGEPSTIVRVGDLAYINIGPRLTIWDVADPAAPKLTGETAPLDAIAAGVAVVGDLAYVSDRSIELSGELHVVDVSDPAAPAILKSMPLTDGEYSSPGGVAVHGDQLFVADQEQGVVVLDLATPAAPTITSVLGTGGVTDVQVVGSRLYVISKGFTGDFGITGYDLDAELAELGSFSVGDAAGVAIGGGDLVVGVGVGGLQAFDLTDLANPVTLFSDPSVLSRAAALVGEVAWIPAIDGLHRLDLSGEPAITDFDIDSNGANAAVVEDGTLSVVTDRGQLLNVDVSAATPTLTARKDISIAGNAIGVFAAGEHIYVADGAGGLRVGTVDDLTATGRGAPDVMPDFEDVVVDGDFAYVADWFFGLRVYDVSDPAVVSASGSLATPTHASSIDLEDGMVYIGDSTNGGSVRVIDVSDPAAPDELGFVDTSKVRDLVVRDKIVYVADEAINGPGGFLIVDATNPAAPALVGEYRACDSVYVVALLGEDHAIIACPDGFQILDISDPTQPTKVADVALGAEVSGFSAAAVVGDVAYLGHDLGVEVVDVSDPAAPARTGSLATVYPVRSLDVSLPGRLLAAAGLAGVYQWTLP